MLHNDHPVPTDNGLQFFLADDVEQILSDYFLRNSEGQRFYQDHEILDNHDISRSELNRMLYRLSYDYCHDKDGNYKWGGN